MKRLMNLILIITVFFLNGCILKQETPKSPPVFNINGTINRQAVLDYQEAILNYITYLEQYYITIGVYYQGNVTFPVKTKRDDQCRIVTHLFKDIELPPPPKVGSRLINDTLHSLIDHITDLRKLIRSNNLYMDKLRQQYKNCK